MTSQNYSTIPHETDTHATSPRRKRLLADEVQPHVEQLELRLMMSAAQPLVSAAGLVKAGRHGPAIAVDVEAGPIGEANEPPLGAAQTSVRVIERSADSEGLFDPDDDLSDGVMVLSAASGGSGTVAGNSPAWWSWYGWVSIPDGPNGEWVGLYCHAPSGVPAGATVTKVQLHHEISHTYVGDLEVVLFNDSNLWVVRDNEGGSSDNVNETRTALSLFDGDRAAQVWHYRVRDTAAYDVGGITALQLYVYYDEGSTNTAPEIGGLPDVTVNRNADSDGFAGKTAAYLTCDGDRNPTDGATPRGESYMLVDHWGGSWCDAEKVPPYDPDGVPPGTGDDWMCWAGAASNVLEWTGWGNVGGMTNTDQMFAYFQDHWTDQGGLAQYGWDWWFDGTNPTQGWSGWSQVDVPGGRFHPNENLSNYLHTQSNESQAMSAIDDYLRAGYGTTLSIRGPDGGHAITVWGFNYDSADPDRYVGIWVTDSDDYKHMSNAPDRLRYYEVEKSGGRWYLRDYYGSDSWYVYAVRGLAPRDADVDGTDLWAYASDAQTPDNQLAFSIVGNTDPNCGVSIASDNHTLLVNPTAGWDGTSSVTVQVSDGELTDTDTFTVTGESNFVDSISVQIGGPQAGALTFADADGTVVSVALTTGGTATLHLTGEGIRRNNLPGRVLLTGTGIQLDSIELAGTSLADVLVITAAGGDGVTTVGRATSQTPLGMLSAPYVDFVGDGIEMTGDGYARTVIVHDMADGADIVMLGQGASTGVVIRANRLSDQTDVTLGSPLSLLRAAEWLGGRLDAPWASNIIITGNASQGVRGDFGADVTLSEADASGYALRVATIPGDIRGGVWDLGGNVASIYASSTSAGWALNADGWIGSLFSQAAMGGSVRANYIHVARTLGDLTADLSLTGWNAGGVSLGSLLAGQVVGDVTLSAAGLVNLIRVSQWQTGQIAAGGIRTLLVTRNPQMGLDGDFGADVTLDAAHVPAGQPTFVAATIHGDLTSDLWDITGDLGNLSVGGAVRGTSDHRVTVRSTGDMNLVVANRFDRADFLAGIAADVTDHATAYGEFATPLAKIGTLRVLGVGLNGQCLADSQFSAGQFGVVDFSNADDVEDADVDLWCRDSSQNDEILSLRYRDPTTGNLGVYSSQSSAGLPAPGFLHIVAREFRLPIRLLIPIPRILITPGMSVLG